ncbi:thioredoxin family protein [Pseudotabrizicola sediminis]|uniref:Thioredoxin family protein n=1 Tax=Pseudotabrizicola sediminis TaxID=2486418 RepID=A0ABY2KJ75_9RHOB|nr:thioredoxin family protein [Pseudotabrizicola sediminis]TGD42450.1 thioredoxin family protein [Pseudotabrizicola sediminis]TGD65182.1 thioredoxin family protein [Tabrizicola sp. WMC-M-20]
MLRTLFALTIATGLWGPFPAVASELELLMIEQPGCIYCAAWDAEIAPQYPLTDEGKAAPLARQQLRAALPDGVVLHRPPVFTPTFILLHNGVETGRIEGYPGEDFFWPLLAGLLEQAGNTTEQ